MIVGLAFTIADGPTGRSRRFGEASSEEREGGGSLVIVSYIRGKGGGRGLTEPSLLVVMGYPLS